MKQVITLALLLMPLLAIGITRHVALDGTQQYSVIQNAINDAVSGDVVLVHPGRYLENLNLSNKSGIILASLEYTTSDTTYISSTIIDGNSNNNSTILCYENTVNCTIRGFSITGGSGYAYYGDSSPWQIFGGGIFINMSNSISLLNLIIHDNKASGGGGVAVFAPNTVQMSNVQIFSNVARYIGGGLLIGSDPVYLPNIVFDQVNRCSIYNNLAQWGMDLHWRFINGGSVSVYLKKFTVPQWEMYYADYYDSDYPTSPYTVFDIHESYLQPVDADLYVSPTGNDNNSGLAPTTALKTPSRAMQRIASHPDNPRTVHLLAGEHHNVFAGEYLPIAIKDYTILCGVSQNQTRLYAENLIEGTGVVTMGIERYGMTLRDLSITTSNASAVFSWGVHNCLVDNITIENSTVNRWLLATGHATSTFTLKNITMRNNTAYYSDYGMILIGVNITMDSIIMENNHTQGLPIYWYQRGCGGYDIYIYGLLTISNSKFINNTHYSEEGFANFRVITLSHQSQSVLNLDNCLFASNYAYSGVRDIVFSGVHVVNLINCTFANNNNEYSDYIVNSCDSTRIINCLFSNNNSTFEIRTTNNALIENCLFSRDANIWRTLNGNPLNWGQNNLIGTDPLFSGSDPTLPSYYYLFADEEHGYSPAIDAGTMDIDTLPLGYAVPEYDAFGYNRLFGNGIDIGCYESQGYTGVEDDELTAIGRLQLYNYPNPFNPVTSIKYDLAESSLVRMDIFNVKGQLVKTLLNQEMLAGTHSVIWDGKDGQGRSVSSGVYFYRMSLPNKVLTNKMLLLK